jgi:hypothetical protein
LAATAAGGCAEFAPRRGDSNTTATTPTARRIAKTRMFMVVPFSILMSSF